MIDTYLEIVSKLEIHADGWISHADYPSSVPSLDAIRCFHQLPSKLQQRFLSLELQNFLYQAFFSGSLNAPDPTESEVLINNTVRGVDVEFFERLDRSNCGQGYVDRGWQICGEEEDGSLAIVKNNLTLHIKPSIHLVDHDSITNIVSIRLPHNLIEDDYYVAVSDKGIIRDSDSDYNHPLLNFFFNVESEAAIVLMQKLTQILNSNRILFTLKFLYQKLEYPRYNAGILTIEKSNYTRVFQLIYKIYLQHSSFFKPEVPWMTKYLEPGLAIAEVPYDLTPVCSNFGLHRCKIVADSLLQVRDSHPQLKMKAIAHHFSQQGIDLQHPYLNPMLQAISP